eukprot:4288689-Karenia_brevis.AAC.1
MAGELQISTLYNRHPRMATHIRHKVDEQEAKFLGAYLADELSHARWASGLTGRDLADAMDGQLHAASVM